MTAASSTASAAAVRKSTYARGVDIFTHTDQVDTALLAVSARAEAWAQVGLDEKIDMLKAIKCRMIKCSMQIGAANAVVRFMAAWHRCIVTRNLLSSCGMPRHHCERRVLKYDWAHNGLCASFRLDIEQLAHL